MGEFVRDRLPDPVAYFEAEGVPLKGQGTWRTGPCPMHGGSDSLRVNVQTGGWRCMACQEHGGDVLAFEMQRHAIGFVDAARNLGAYVEDGKPHRGPATPATLPARDAMQLAAWELQVAWVVMCDVRAGIIPSDPDWNRFVTSCARVEALATEYRA